MASSKLLSQSRWNRFLRGNLSNVRLFSDLASQHPVSEHHDNVDRKSNNKFNKASSTPSSLKEPELAKFAAIADTWWDSEGPFKPLHKMNPTRLAFIRSTLCRHF
ncbi:ubiquinone biosynthesis O-methyltransferase, mitochondrial-like [Hibiscus syriacus]|nr:ubiquinone biosynthesis O-methyltransferase, mitochondrial-like [Hibiscus syriacus]